MTPLEAMARAMAPHVAGPSFDDLAPNRHEQKRLHREGLVFDINQPTQADLMGAAKAALHALQQNVSFDMAEEASRVAGDLLGGRPQTNLDWTVVVVAALTAALNEGDGNG